MFTWLTGHQRLRLAAECLRKAVPSQDSARMLAPAHRETLLSFLGRLATSKGVRVADLAFDLGGSIRKFLNHDPAAIDSLAAWAGLSDHQLQELLTWSGRAVGNVRTSFRGEIFVSRALRNPVVRGCLDCLREDTFSHPAAPLDAMILRGDWQFREVSICVRHRRPLAELWTAAKVIERYNVPARLGEMLPRILDALEPSPIELSAYDLWLDRRMEDGNDTTALASRSLYAGTTFCRLLGGELLRIDGVEPCDPINHLRLAQAAGFEVARQGDEAIRGALYRIAACATGKLDEPNAAFGELFTKFKLNYCDDAAFAPFIGLLRECILDVWPVAAGEDLLGTPTAERRLHSIVTAADEAGVSPALAKQFLVEAGAITRSDPRPDGRTTFPAAPYRDLLSMIPRLVQNGEMRRRMGATAVELKTLEEGGVLTPRTRVPTTRARWLVEDGLIFIAELQALVSPVAPDDGEWEGIQQAKVRHGVPIAQIIAAIRSGDVRIGRRTFAEGYRSFVVAKMDTNALRAEPSGPIAEEVISVAAFGRSIGLRDGGLFLAMADAGHISCRSQWNAKTQKSQLVMTRRDIAAFHSTYLTTRTISIEYGLHRNAVRTILKMKGALPFTAYGRSYGMVFLRGDIERHFT
ncbi:TniQ family protein [Frigidibacter albus]|nr:TniQ family protein [Frigidibacter albus]